MTDLHDRAAALAGELIVLKREAALAADQPLNQALKEVTRRLKQRGAFSEESYDRLVERLTEELWGEAVSQERAVQERKECSSSASPAKLKPTMPQSSRLERNRQSSERQPSRQESGRHPLPTAQHSSPQEPCWPSQPTR